VGDHVIEKVGPAHGGVLAEARRPCHYPRISTW
jgi:hypothetical protein